MKVFIIAITTFVTFINVQADISRPQKVNEHKQVLITKNNKKKKRVSQSVIVHSAAIERNSVAQINAEAEKKNAEAVQAFMQSRKIGVTDNTNSFDVNTGTTLKGIILNSVVSSNLASPIDVLVTDSNCDIPINTKLVCSGTTKGKRVQTICTKLVDKPDEFTISAILLNPDGTAGLTGEVFTGKEELVIGALAGGGLSAALDVSRDRVLTATGELATNSQRNKMLTGAMGGLDEAVSIMGEEAKSKDTKITIEAGKVVLIYINQRFKI